MRNNKIIIGLSGGVDSSVAALILKKQGYEVIGAFMKNFSDTKNQYTGECSYLEDKRMAQTVANHLKIDLLIFDFEKEYKKLVIEKMYRDYKKGLTPNPDILCNKMIKFPLFYKEAKKHKASLIAMGHYARIIKKNNEFRLLAGKDEKKDQSYFLADLNQKDLSHTLFPLGEMTKKEVRMIAKKNKLPNWNRHGTVGICFVGKVNMQNFLRKKIKEKIGQVINPEGEVIGTHLGAEFYTIGQKATNNIGIIIKKEKELAQKKFYIAKKLKNNKILVAPEGHDILFKKEIKLKYFKRLTSEKLENKKMFVRIRHQGKLHPGKLKKNKFLLDKALESICPGQIAVFYKKDRVLASAEITN